MLWSWGLRCFQGLQALLPQVGVFRGGAQAQLFQPQAHGVGERNRPIDVIVQEDIPGSLAVKLRPAAVIAVIECTVGGEVRIDVQGVRRCSLSQMPPP